jgi:tetratricopeptide (TPR) repeat protein
MLSTSPPARRLFFALLLTVATILAYHGAWNGGFIWDDDAYVTKNPLLTAADGLSRIWFSFDAPSQYFPLVYTVFRWERSWWGLQPTGYHWVNLLLHLGNALLVWRLLGRLRIPGALFAAFIFALHPVQVESVAWITELKNVLMGFFFLLTLLAWVKFVDDRTKRRWLFYGAGIFFYTLALSAKTTACTLPAALLLILWYEEKRISARRLAQVLPFALLGLAAGLLTIWWERFHQGTHGDLFSLGPVERLLVASHAIWFYLGKLLWPHNLTFIYPQWQISPNDPSAYGWMLALLAATAVIVAIRKRTGRGVAVAALFFVTTLGPVLGFIMLYTFRYTYVADHYQYLASIGPIALGAAALSRTAEKGPNYRAAAFAVGAIILASIGLLTWRQATMYRDVETLWQTTISRNPACWMAYNNMGIELARRGEFEQAIAQYHKSLGLHSDYAQAHYNLATALLERGDPDGALSESRLAVQLQPNDPDAHIALGNAVFATGDLDQAVTQYTHALRLNPDNADALYDLGNVAQQKGEIASAIDLYNKALRLNPEIMEAHLNLGNVLLERGDEKAAISHYESALVISPASIKVLNNFAWALVSVSDKSLRNGSRALQLAQQANRLVNGGDPLVLNTLGAAYAETGQFDQAIQVERRALELATHRGDEALAAEIRRVLLLYSQGTVYRADRSKD